MKQVVFKKIRIQNFLSVGEDPLELSFNSGLNIITGVNLDKEDSMNGVGKSTTADALFFALFGSTIRELKKEQIVNNINKRNCKVMISFDVIQDGAKKEYVVARSILPTKLQLIEDGIDVTKSSIPKTTNQICKIISSSQEVFENSVIMTANNTVPFMAQKKVNKRKFIEGILRLGVFSEMLLLARSQYNESKKNVEIEQTKINEVNKTHDIYVEQQRKQKAQKQDRIDVLLAREKDNQIEEKDSKQKLTKVSNDQEDTFKNNIKLLSKKEKDCQTKIRRIDKKIATKEANIESNENRITELVELGDACITCKRPFETGDKSTLISERKKLKDKNKELNIKIKEHGKELKELEDLKDKCSLGIKKFNDKIHENNIKIKENENVKAKLKQLDDWNKQIKIDLAKLQDEHDEFAVLIKQSKERIDVLNEQLKKIRDRLNNLDVVKFIVSEEGVKSYIVKKILKVLNGKLLYYLNKLDAPCVCNFNEYFEETIINDKGQECSYHNFSGGERRRIDLAMLFTFMDIRRLQADVQLNISFYDEILDTSLDDKGIDLFLDILKERTDKYKECVYIISHKKSAIKSATNDVIFLEKKNGFTYLVEPGEESE